MKIQVGLLSSLLLIVGLFTYLLVTFRSPNALFFEGTDEAERFTALISEFAKIHRPIVELNLTALYGGDGQFQVLSPSLDLKALDAGEPLCRETDPALVSACHADPPGWLERLARSPSEVRSAKDRALAAALSTGTIANDFLTEPPYTDPYGRSYAYVLTTRGTHPFNERPWVERHLSFFKTSELSEILAKFHLDRADYRAIAKMTSEQLEQGVRGAKLILTSDSVLVKTESYLGFSPLKYRVYDLAELRAFLRGGPYALEPASLDIVCLAKVGAACWTYSSGHLVGFVYRYLLVALLSVGFCFLACLGLFLRHLALRHQEQLRQRLSLQVLSHEFRTPVAALLLISEQLRKVKGQRPDADEDLLTRMSGEIFRLQRIVETSRTYLQAGGHGLAFREANFPSANEWVSEFLEEAAISGQPSCQFLERDVSFRADPFWLRFVMTNLLQNAFAHGREPVRLVLLAESDRLTMRVEDAGSCDFASLHEMTKAFVKSPRSGGMGLGLNIVKTVVDEWRAKLEFTVQPTAFSLTLQTGEKP